MTNQEQNQKIKELAENIRQELTSLSLDSKLTDKTNQYLTEIEAIVDKKEETPEEKLARLEVENARLREQVEQRKTGQLRLRVSEKGGLSVYGLGRFPVTLYKEQWLKLLDYADEIRSFLKENDAQLKAKQ